MQLEKIKLSELVPDSRNARKHDKRNVDEVARSLKQLGQHRAFVVQRGTNKILVGNGMFEAMKQLGWTEGSVYFVDDNDETAIKRALADNRTAELAEWNMDVLSELLGEMEIPDIPGWTEDEINELIGANDPEPEEIVEDIAPDAQEEAISQLGDIWLLGRHRLMCGDSTDAGAVETLMGGVKADLVLTDPPYGMGKESDGVLNDNLDQDRLLEFNVLWIPLSFEHLKDNGSWYCWGMDEPLMDIYSNIIKPMIKTQRATFRNLITWDKGGGQGQTSSEFRMYPTADEKCLFIMCGVQGFNNNSDNYYEGWEPIRKYLFDEWRKISPKNNWNELLGNHMGKHYFTKSQWELPTEKAYRKLQELGKEHSAFKKEHSAFKKEYSEIKKEYYSTRAYFDNTHDNMNNVWHFDRTNSGERDETGGHATPKPIALCARAIKSSSRVDELVLDPFGGSGSTLIACEQLNRTCYMMELAPQYVDVIIKRWQNLTGKTAIHEATGEPFASE